VFSLGAVLTFAASGFGPFGTGSAPALIYRVVHRAPDTTAVPAQLRPLVERCLAKEPGDRPTTDELLAELGAGHLAPDWLPAPVADMLARYLPSGATPAPSPAPACAEPLTTDVLAAPTPVAPASSLSPAGSPPPAAPAGPLAAPREGAPGGGPRRGSRRRLAWIGAGATAVLAAAVAVIVVASSGGAGAKPDLAASSRSPSAAAGGPLPAGPAGSGTRGAGTGRSGPGHEKSAGPSASAGAHSASASASASTAPARVSSPATPAAPAPGIAGTWHGSYTCFQGGSGLTLSITARGGGQLTAVFSFFALASNPGQPSGSFVMTGSVSGSSVTLNPEYWIKQPEGYSMVQLTGTQSGGHFSGSVTGGAGCTTFSVTK
jgi:hypothetical protein